MVLRGAVLALAVCVHLGADALVASPCRLGACSSHQLERKRTTRPRLTGAAPPPPQPSQRLREAVPCGDDLDRRIVTVAVPSIANLAVAPLVGAVDTFWVGRMGDALALAGQGAANTCFFAVFFLVAFIPTVTAPLVARAAGEGDMESAKKRICEALYLANVIGLIGMLVLVCRPGAVLSLVMSTDSAALPYAIKYLRFRSISMVPALFSAVSFAAFRGIAPARPRLILRLLATHRRPP